MEADRTAAARLAAPFHAGECAAQERVGVRARMEKVGASMVREYMPEQHREFFPLLPALFAGAADNDGRLWASVLWGAPGFVRSQNPTTLRVQARFADSDPLAAALRPGTPIGLLGLQFETRRRNRANGEIAAADTDGFTFGLWQSFGNCAKYIQMRTQSVASSEPPGVALIGGADLTDAALALIRRADTFFIATAVDESQGVAYGADVSHRGGRPGFVRVEPGGIVTWPDFRGNNFFNTIGNLAVDRRAGLLFIDFDRGDLLHLSGQAEVLWDAPELERIPMAERLFRFVTERHVFRPSGLPLRWALCEQSPNLDASGVWPPTASR